MFHTQVRGEGFVMILRSNIRTFQEAMDAAWEHSFDKQPVEVVTGHGASIVAAVVAYPIDDRVLHPRKAG